MTTDKMQDVHPINYDYKEGEQPTSQKLTGGVKQVDAAFSKMAIAIGDPWDYATHSIGSLSLENLGIPNISRLIGSSDWLSPDGIWNEPIASSYSIKLKADKNSWILGFPLVKVTSDLTKSSTGSSVTPLTWGTDITVAVDADGVLTGSPKASKALVVSDGDFYVDFYKGTIEAYEVTSADITLTFPNNNLNMLGPGVPWGTHNVIPYWNQSTPLCSVAKVGDFGTISRWTLSLPSTINGYARQYPLRVFGKRSYTDSTDDDVDWQLLYSGRSAKYRIPSTLTTAGLSNGDTIPDGYCWLWEGGRTGRVVPQVTFKYVDEYSFTLETPIDWLTAGANYRVIIPGTSLSENINYLMQQVRNNEHVGLTDNPTIGYTMPLSHDNLEDRYTGDIDNSLADIERYQFRESSYPTNSHPQYLHRGGYMTSDENGNTSNAMRGDFVLSGDVSGDGTGGFYLDDSENIGQNVFNSFGIFFGGGYVTKDTANINPGFRLEGLYLTTAGSGSEKANRIAFSLTDTGTANTDHTGAATDEELVGALAVYPGATGPLFLKGYYDSTAGKEIKNGAVLGFDLGHRNEPNYIRAMEGVRDGTYDVINLPAKKSQGDTELSITPDLDAAPGTTKRLSPEQMREFRFRGVAYVSGATNTNDGIGGSNTRGVLGSITEFQEYFTSPGIVGADFFNVYSNAIFFSDSGDGKTTSFTDGGDTWLNNTGTFNGYTPSGIYFEPYDGVGTEGQFVFSVDENGTASQPLKFGDTKGLTYLGASVTVEADTSDVQLTAKSDIKLYAGNSSAGYILLDTHTNSGDDILLSSNSAIDLTADNAGRILIATDSSTGNIILQVANPGYIVMSGIATGAGAAPGGLPSGGLWVDTSAGRVIKHKA